jgi:hypothetical protein
MTISAGVREQVRRRANFACEFCGVAEADTGGQLTIDHFQPTSKGGNDSLDNLIYCCFRCNQYKLDYWAVREGDPRLWNPRRETASQHFLALDDGSLHPLTEQGAFTLRRLRLNRPALIAYRLQRIRRTEEINLLARYNDLINALERLLHQQAVLLEEQQKLLQEQRRLLQELLRDETQKAE